MKREDDFKNILRDMGSDPFYIHYHCTEQVHIYRNYCKNVEYPRLVIDATGSVVKNFSKFGFEKTRCLFVYEALVYDSIRKHSFTVANMISERHTSIAIFNWLAKWISCDLPNTKETVCDQSIALLLAISRCFTQYSSLKDYIQICADIVFEKIPSDSYWLPKCFIRTDVAHFIKLVSKWATLKTSPRRVREIILCVIGIVLKSQSINFIRQILLSLFIVITNETDGKELATGDDTPCEQHKRVIIQTVTTDFVEIEDLLGFIEVDEHNIDEEYEYEYNDN